MAGSGGGYLKATRHPWPCLLFMLPLLLAYEGGVLWLGRTKPEALRNGADTWLHMGLQSLGFPQLYWVPALVAVIFLAWSWYCRKDRPGDITGLFAGMAMESIIFAGGLWLLGRVLGPYLQTLSIMQANSPPPEQTITKVITYVGAGIYEEVLFRLGLFSILFLALRKLGMGPTFVVILAAIGSALIFSSAHHSGPYGEPYNKPLFLFRTLAGVYFALVYYLRGFGVAMGAHAGYDVLVGIVIG